LAAAIAAVLPPPVALVVEEDVVAAVEVVLPDVVAAVPPDDEAGFTSFATVPDCTVIGVDTVPAVRELKHPLARNARSTRGRAKSGRRRRIESGSLPVDDVAAQSIEGRLPCTWWLTNRSTRACSTGSRPTSR
jgi:hypothetical protein